MIKAFITRSLPGVTAVCWDGAHTLTLYTVQGFFLFIGIKIQALIEPRMRI